MLVKCDNLQLISFEDQVTYEHNHCQYTHPQWRNQPCCDARAQLFL